MNAKSPNRSASTDNEIVLDVLAGHTEQFGHIAERYQRALLRFAHNRLGNLTAAEDVVQETMLSAFKSLSTFNPKYNFRTWLWTILFNHCTRRYRRDRPTLQADPEAFDAELDRRHGLPGDNAQQNETRRMLRVLLNRLPEAQADALRLRFFGGLQYQEIADTMGCSLSGAKNRVRLGLMKLSESITHTRPCDSGDQTHV